MKKEQYFTFSHLLLLSLLFFLHFVKVLKENIDIKKENQRTKKITIEVLPNK